jgi:hypothetical protein
MRTRCGIGIAGVLVEVREVVARELRLRYHAAEGQHRQPAVLQRGGGGGGGVEQGVGSERDAANKR